MPPHSFSLATKGSVNDMNTPAISKPVQFYCQAAYFLEAAMAVSKDATENKHKHPVAYNNYEMVIVGTHHAFAMEIMLKGYILFHTSTYPHEHSIHVLMDDSACRQLKIDIQKKFEKSKAYAYTETQLNAALDSYVSSLDQSKKDDRKECQNIKDIRKNEVFGSFEYFIRLHGNNFVRMRYACERLPPPLDMTFTSFLCSEIKDALKTALKL